MHVCVSDRDVQTVEIHFYDKQGLDISPGEEKKLERLYFRQEFRRAFFDEVGEIIYPARAIEYYEAGLFETLGQARRGRRAPRPRSSRTWASASAPSSCRRSPARCSLELITLSPFVDAERTYITAEERKVSLDRLRSTVTTFEADLGAAFDVSSEHLTLITPTGELLDGDTALHAVVSTCGAAADDTGAAIAVPLSASRVVERIADADRPSRRADGALTPGAVRGGALRRRRLRGLAGRRVRLPRRSSPRTTP